jgi:hypothetical protein
MKFRVFWDVAPCSHVEFDRRFRGAYCVHHQGLMMEVVRTSETSVKFNVTTGRYSPEDSKLFLAIIFVIYVLLHLSFLIIVSSFMFILDSLITESPPVCQFL